MTIKDLPDSGILTLVSQMAYRPLSDDQSRFFDEVMEESARRFGK